MRRSRLAALALSAPLGLALLFATARADGGDLAVFLGRWHATASDADVVSAVVTQDGSAFSIETFGKCVPAACDMGSGRLHFVPLSKDGVVPLKGSVDAKTTIHEKFARRDVTIHTDAGGSLRLEMHTRFTDGSGRKAYDLQVEMTRG